MIKEMILSPSNLGSFSLKERGMEGQRGATLEGLRSPPPSLGMGTIALMGSQLLCISVASPAFNTQATPHCEHQCQGGHYREPFSGRQNKAQAMPSREHRFWGGNHLALQHHLSNHFPPSGVICLNLQASAMRRCPD